MSNFIDTLGDLWKHQLNQKNNFLFMIFFALMLLSCSFAYNISRSQYERIFKEAKNQLDITTIVTTTSTTTTTTSRPISGIKQCGLLKDKICVNRAECSTTRRNKIVIDLQPQPLSACHYLETCCHPNDVLSKDEHSMTSDYELCGVSNVGGIFLTVKNGEVESSFAEFPWTVAILNQNQELICSGALLTDKVILTTASCLFPEQSLIVRAGEWDLRTDKEPLPYENRKVKNRIIHKRFSWNLSDYNIGILILKKPFSHLKHMAPVCLDNGDTALDVDNCFISGWHVRQPYLTSVPKREIVLKIKMDLVTKSSSYSAGREFGGYIKTERPVTVSGAPLVCPTKGNRYYLVGAWSFGMNATTFTDVRAYKGWIREELARHNIEI